MCPANQLIVPIFNLPYLTNISTAVSCIFLFIPFQDFLSLKTCLASRGSLWSVSGGASGSGRGSITTDWLSLDFLLIKLGVILCCIPLLFLKPIVISTKVMSIRTLIPKLKRTCVLKIVIAVASFLSCLAKSNRTKLDT